MVAGITEVLAEANVNIVDIDQTVIRKLFSIFMIVDFSMATQPFEEVEKKLRQRAAELNLTLSIEPYVYGDAVKPKEEKNLMLITIVGRDRPGIVARFSRICADSNVNIERIKMIARGPTIAMEMLVDVEKLNISFEEFKERLHQAGLDLNLSLIIQRRDVFRRAKKLVVFDLDMTLIEQEIINELAKAAGVEKEVAEITKKAMEGEIDYKESLKQRVKLLKGLPASIFDEVFSGITLTQGAHDLLLLLKEIGCKIAIVTGSFKQIVEKLAQKYDIDYLFANELVVENGVLTGEVKEPIIDAEAKRKIILELLQKEDITREEVIAVGDGANDRFMLMEAGVGIAFNAKEKLKKIADGVLTKDNLLGLIYCIRGFVDF